MYDEAMGAVKTVEFGEVLAPMMVYDTFSLHVQRLHVCKNMVLSSSKLNNVNISAEIRLKERSANFKAVV